MRSSMTLRPSAARCASSGWMIGGNPPSRSRSGRLLSRGSNRKRFGGGTLSDLVDRVVEATKGTELECGPWQPDYRPRASLRRNRSSGRPRSGILRASSASYRADYRSGRPPAFRHHLIAPDQLGLEATRIRTIGAAEGTAQHEKCRRGARSSDSRSSGDTRALGTSSSATNKFARPSLTLPLDTRWMFPLLMLGGLHHQHVRV